MARRVRFRRSRPPGPLAESVYAQGGVISGFAGDAVTALFPGDDAAACRRALAAA